MTALELLDLVIADPSDPRIDAEHERLSGIAVPGDVEPELARRFVIGELVRREFGAGHFPERRGSPAHP